MQIIYVNPEGVGWSPITYMAKLAAELFEADLLEIGVDLKPTRNLRQVFNLMRWRNNPKGDACLLICPSATELLAILTIQNWRKRYNYLAAWIIDSFWVNWIPKVVRLAHPFDHFFITTAEDIPAWIQATKTPITWLPWGSDVLRLGNAGHDRPWDLIRVGRQPPDWDNDDITQQACQDVNLRFHGRPHMFNDQIQNHFALLQLYAQSKFLLAFSNRVNPTNYTHPVRQYVTGRWVDALASGAIVAGIAPREPSLDRLLWAGATLDLPSLDRQAGLLTLVEAVQHWTPDLAVRNYYQALERLDWRWRFAEIARVFKLFPPRLDAEISLVKEKIAQLQQIAQP